MGPLCPPPLPQILTQEDWNVVLYNGMASTSSWAALYFVALMTFGNYVLFNLLVAILVEGFQVEVTVALVEEAPLWGLYETGGGGGLDRGGPQFKHLAGNGSPEEGVTSEVVSFPSQEACKWRLHLGPLPIPQGCRNKPLHL